jgi:hypothetical protein
MTEMAGALVRARQILNPVVYLEELRDLLGKQQTGKRTLLESLLSSLGEDLLVPLAEKVPEEDEEETARFASLYAEVGDLVRALAPASPIAKRFETEQQLLQNVFREISRRNNAEKAEKIRTVQKHYAELLKARTNAAREQPKAKRLRRLSLAFLVLGVVVLVDRCTTFLTQVDKAEPPEPGTPLLLSWILLSLFATVCGLIGGFVIGRGGGPIAALLGAGIGGFAGLLAGWGIGWVVQKFWLFFLCTSVSGALVAAAVCFRRYRQMVESAGLTAEESSAYQESINNIEEYFRQKQKLDEARAILAAARACPLSLDVVTQELGIGA